MGTTHTDSYRRLLHLFHNTQIDAIRPVTFALMSSEFMNFELLLSLKQMAGALGGLLEKGYSLVGPVAPFLFLVGLLEGVVFLFLLSLPLWASRRRRRSERDFLVHLEKGNGTLSNIAIVTGFVGTYLGLMEMLPVLATIVEGEASDGTTGELLSGLGSAFVSSMVGLGLGGIVGSVNEYLLDVLIPGGTDSEKANLQEDVQEDMTPERSFRNGRAPHFDRDSRLLQAVEQTLASSTGR